MALRVTQCPSCESSFNTSAAMLNLAEGKVRCGACLTVFYAVDNFLEPDSEDEAQDSDSVFVGNNPLDYFDPSSFLTRSALQEKHEEIQGSDEKPALEIRTEISSSSEHLIADSVAQDQVDFTDPPINEETIELSEEYTREFFSSIEKTMEESLQQAESEKDLLLEQLQENEASFFEDFQTSLMADSEPLEAELFPDSSHELVDPFAAKKPEFEEHIAPQDGENDVFDIATAATDRREPQADFNPIQATDIAAVPTHTITETLAPPLSQDLFPESIPVQSDEELPPMDEFIAQSITEITTLEDSASENSDTDAKNAAATIAQQQPQNPSHQRDEPGQPIEESRHQLTENKATEIETYPAANKTAHSDNFTASTHASWQSSSATPTAKPEDMQLSVSFSLQHGPGQRRQSDEPQANTAAANESALRQNLDSADEESSGESAGNFSETYTEDESELETEPVSATNAELLEQDINREIAEREFKESVAAGITPPDSEFETAINDEVVEPAQVDENFASDEELHSPTEEETAKAGDVLTETAESAEDTTEIIRARALGAQLEDETALESISQESIAALDVTSTPVELLAGKQIRIGRFIGFSVVILLLSISLGSQHFWRNRVAYSQDIRFRPFFEQACTFATCDLPTYSDISAIRSDNLAVRSHPSLENGLSVNIEFRNTAELPQAFPILVLSFNSANNDIVALREFAPSEYLSPGLRDVSLMPSMSPVQVNLEVIDPGPGAVNYTLAFRLP